MGPEILVLGRDEGLLHHVGNRRIRHEDASLGGQLGHQPRVAGVDPAHHRRLVVAQPIDVRQVGAEALPRDVAADAADHGHQQADAEAARRPRRARSGGTGCGAACAAAAVAACGPCGCPGGWRQLFAGCQGFVHESGDMALFGASRPAKRTLARHPFRAINLRHARGGDEIGIDRALHRLGDPRAMLADGAVPPHRPDWT